MEDLLDKLQNLEDSVMSRLERKLDNTQDEIDKDELEERIEEIRDKFSDIQNMVASTEY
jgi:predicted KAP-like P-loop ATPase